MSIPSFCVKRPVTTLMIYCAVVAFGLIGMGRIPVEMLPESGGDRITIFVGIRGGLPPTEIESLIVRPIEEAVATCSNLESLDSSCEKDKATVSLKFKAGTNMDFAGLEVREKFGRIKNKLPKETEKPVVARYQESDSPVFIAAAASAHENFTTEQIRKIVERKVKERLMRIKGVANVDIYGGREEKILVEFDKNKLDMFQLPIRMVISRIGGENISLLAGVVKGDTLKRGVRMIGAFKTLEDVKDLIVRTMPNGTQLKLKSVAEVKDDYMEAQSYSRVDNDDVVSIYIKKESNANTVEVCSQIQEFLTEVGPTLGSGIFLIPLADQSVFIKDAIRAVLSSLCYGGFLAIVILFFTLRSYKSTLIIGISMPVSVVATFAAMYFQNISFNIMTLSGLALGIGMMVDSSIVVIENIFKYRTMGMNSFDASIKATEEVVLPLIASTITSIVVFLPIVFISEEIKRTYIGFAKTVTFSLIASFFAAVTLIPSLAAKLKLSAPKIRDGHDFDAPAPETNKLLLLLENTYLKIAPTCFKFRYLLVAASLALCFYTVLRAVGMDKELISSGEQGKFTIYVKLKDGAKLDISDQVVTEVEQIVSDPIRFPEVRNVSSNVDGWFSKVYITLKPAKERKKNTKEVMDDMREALKNVGRAQDTHVFFSGSEDGVGGKKVEVDIYGYDSEKLRKLTNEIAGKMGTVDGVTDVVIHATDPRPEYRIIVNKDQAAYLGMTVSEIAEDLHAQVKGLRCTTMHRDGKEVEMVGRLQERFRKRKDDLRNLTLFNGRGEMFKLEQVAHFENGTGPSEIWRKNKRRMLKVEGNSALSLNKAVEQIKEVLKDVKFPEDYYYEFTGEYSQMVETNRQMSMALWLTIALVFMTLASLFESYLQPLIIMITVPLAMIGAINTLYYVGASISIGVIIGAIMLAGVVVNNGIILIDRINGLREEGVDKWDAVVRTGKDRLRPIFMTTSTSVLGLLPMALDRSESAEMFRPLAITVMGGLSSSTILTLVVVPGMYLILEDITGLFGRIFKRSKA